ncbi:MAG TPA: VWA domain-containing protein [Pyrinomonadaceae bacterium]|nr:VWA domain-containing protein [Pyrinomonadaceae bacterium]
MKFRSLLLSLLIAVFGIGPFGQSARAQTPTDQVDDVIRVESDLTSLLFIATDRNKRFITSLTETDLHLSEDNALQKIVSFQKETDRPLAIAFLIDVSASEEHMLPNEKAAVRSFIETVIKSSKDQAAIIPFTGGAYLEQDLTRDVFSLYRALERVEVAVPNYLGTGKPLSGISSRPGTLRPPPEGSTAIWEAISLTIREVLAKKRNEPARIEKRKAIILLTDGWDTSSRINAQEVVKSAIADETVIYAIGIGDSKRDGVDKHSLEEVAESTGGRAFFPKKEADLATAFSEIEQELRSQYLITYSSTNKLRDGGFRKIRLSIINPQLQKEKIELRYRPGYVAKPLR